MDECCICLEELDTELTVLPCNHKLHIHCLETLVKTNQHQNNNNRFTCPLCRSEHSIVTINSNGDGNDDNDEDADERSEETVLRLCQVIIALWFFGLLYISLQ